MNISELAATIDHTILKPNVTSNEIEQLCNEAIENGFAAVCIPPYFVKKAAWQLKEHNIQVATVVGFPMGYNATPAKVEEVKRAIDDGADEVDVVVNINAIKEKDWNYVNNDIQSTTWAAQMKGKSIKIIFEMGLLDKEEVEKLCDICNEVGVNFVKTSTGINGKPATVTMVKQLKSLIKEDIAIKASAGIRTQKQAFALLNAGATRLGTSAGLTILGK
jgi:deoxyribose-phosphate aldolase